MQLAEKHVIKKNHKFFKALDDLAFKSKNLYNYANYIIRQEFITNQKYLNYNAIEKQVKGSESYKDLPAKVSQQILKLLDKNWISFFKAIKDWGKNKEKYQNKPGLPSYKHKVTGRYPLIYTNQAISKPKLKKGIIALSKTDIEITTRQTDVQQVRVIPKNDEYVVEVIYNVEETVCTGDPEHFISIDVGLNNLATITSNKIDPVIINGRPLKSINQYYNKKKATLQSYIGDKGTSNKMVQLTNKRNKKVDHYLHVASRRIIDLCVTSEIGLIIIGKNDQWKTNINIGSKNNQNFVGIPHARFINLIEYKAQLVGIEVKLTEESYTSKCSFIDNEDIKKHEVYLGRRVKRGLFKSADGTKFNADVNGSYNIARKVVPDFSILNKGIEGVVVHPVRLAIL